MNIFNRIKNYDKDDERQKKHHGAWSSIRKAIKDANDAAKGNEEKKQDSQPDAPKP